MNGRCGVVKSIIDETIVTWSRSFGKGKSDPPQSQITAVANTGIPKPMRCRRWLEVAPEGYHVLLDNYRVENVVHVPPVTIDKMQSQGVECAIVVLVKKITGRKFGGESGGKLGCKLVYSGCSRAGAKCFVLADFDRSVTPESGRCPSRDFVETVMAGKDVVPKSDFWMRFPVFADVEQALRFDADTCAYDAKKGGDGYQSGSSSSSSSSSSLLTKKRKPKKLIDAAEFVKAQHNSKRPKT
jgi:hypothetical protein